MRPIYLVRDPDLFKQMAIKDFESFENHKFVIDPKLDSLIGNTIFSMSGKKWRDMRSTLSPAFTGRKMRGMFELIRECAEEAADCLQRNPATVGGSNFLEMRGFLARYANDVIASCAFGLKINSHKDRDNRFYTIGRRFQQLSSAKAFLKILLQRSVPWLLYAFGIEFIDSDIREFFSDTILWNIEERQARGIHRADIIDQLMHERKPTVSNADGTLQKTFNFSDKEIVANCFVFFLAGFDTSTWFLTASTYQLALHKDIQLRLIDEIDDVHRTLNGRPITYENLRGMTYMDMVINEILRINPPAVYIDRVCTKDYVLDDGAELNLLIKKGTELWIPIHCYHHDANYFPNPLVFDPERFSDENRCQINPSAFIPFGSGPRACIGSRFAVMEIKALLYFLLLNFTFEITNDTEIPMKLISSAFGVQPANGLNLELRPRK